MSGGHHPSCECPRSPDCRYRPAPVDDGDRVVDRDEALAILRAIRLELERKGHGTGGPS